LPQLFSTDQKKKVCFLSYFDSLNIFNFYRLHSDFLSVRWTYPLHGYISFVLPVFIIILNQFSVQLLLTTSLRKGDYHLPGGLANLGCPCPLHEEV
jgi:hypothetical protein